MLSLSRTVVALGTVATLTATSLSAQQLADACVGLGTQSAASYDAHAIVPPLVARSAQGPKRWPYVVGGALVGAVAGGTWIVHRVAHTDDAMGVPVYAVGVMAAGTGLGALGGLIVSAIVQPYPD